MSAVTARLVQHVRALHFPDRARPHSRNMSGLSGNPVICARLVTFRLVCLGLHAPTGAPPANHSPSQSLPTGEALEGSYRESYWIARLMPEPKLSSGRSSVESVVLQTLAQLRRSHAFLEQLGTNGGVAELHVSLFARENFRLDLSAESLAMLGRLGLAVALEIHPHSPHDIGTSTAS
jgi:hypothetical protein